MDCKPAVAINWPPNDSTKATYWQLFFGRRRGLRGGKTLPALCCEATDIVVDRAQLAAYRAACGLPIDDPVVPLLYPHAMFGSAHLRMIGHERFPLRSLGMLHLRNHSICFRPFSAEQPWTVRCQLARQRTVDKGLEFDFDSTVCIDGEVVWTSVSTFLKRGKPIGVTEESPQAKRFPSMEKDESDQIAEFRIPDDIGKQYAKVTGDYNPIHVSNLAAKLFGFRRAIAHGMWTTARTVPELSEIAAPVRLDVAFKGPMFVGSTAKVQVAGERFDVYCNDNPRPVIVGVHRSASAEEVI